jgi:acyl-coenzyme A thioesterase PaaI-like protein
MLYAKASETSRTSRIATYVVDITNTDGVLIAEYHGTAYRRGETF